MYSGKPAVSLVVSDLVQQKGLAQPEGLRKLNNAGRMAVDLLAEQIAIEVDQILGLQWDRRKGEFAMPVQTDDAIRSISPRNSPGYLLLRIRNPNPKGDDQRAERNPDRPAGHAPAVQRSR